MNGQFSFSHRLGLPLISAWLQGEAVYAARHNADWADAVSIAENHKAHLMAAVLPLGMAPLEAGKGYVKLLLPN